MTINSDNPKVIKPDILTDNNSKVLKRKKVKKKCWLCKWGCIHIDYKDTQMLTERYLKNNKIVSHKVTGTCFKHQHRISTAIKRARMVGLLPFVSE